MVSFLICLALLIGGYFVYGKVVENTFGPDDRETPAVKINDGVDYVVLPQWKLFMIQLLNIAGLGPIFGAMQGALWGPIVFLWITFGTIFAGAVHDYFSGMMSERNNGASISEISGIYLGGFMKNVMRVFSVVLLIMVGTVFAVGPAGLIVTLFKNGGSTGVVTTTLFWLVIVLVYYFIATFISIDKIIGKIYPLFGAALIFMALGLLGVIVFGKYEVPEMTTFHNFQIDAHSLPIIPTLFITIACGAISGFHATQSPLMARCVNNERECRTVFYGAMIAESVIALIWAAIAMAFFSGADGLAAALAEHGNNAAWVVNTVSTTTLGVVGGILAVLGVVAAPVTSGDTAFRSARLIIADVFHIEQRSIARRLMISVPLFAVGVAITFVDFDVVWRYFAWTNQALATVVLWTIAAYLYQRRANMWVVMPVAVFMTFICSSFVFVSGQFFGMENRPLAYGLAVVVTAALTVAMNYKFRRDGKLRG